MEVVTRCEISSRPSAYSNDILISRESDFRWGESRRGYSSPFNDLIRISPPRSTDNSWFSLAGLAISDIPASFRVTKFLLSWRGSAESVIPRNSFNGRRRIEFSCLRKRKFSDWPLRSVITSRKLAGNFSSRFLHGHRERFVQFLFFAMVETLHR